MEDRESDLIGVPQEVGGEGLVPGGLVGLGLGGGPLDGELVDVDGHVGLQGHSHLVTGHELGQLEALGLDHRDLQPPVEHLDFKVVMASPAMEIETMTIKLNLSKFALAGL